MGVVRRLASGISSFGVDAVAGDGVGDDLGLHLAAGGQRRQGGDDDVGGVGLEVASEGLAGVAATEAIGAEGHEPPAGGDPPGDLVGHRLHEVGDGDDRAVAVVEQLGDPRGATGLVGVQPVPALGGERLLAEALVAGGRPQLRGHVVVLEQLPLRLPRRQVGGAGEQDRGRGASVRRARSSQR